MFFFFFFLPVIASYIDSHPLIEGWGSLKTKRDNLNEDFSWILTNLGRDFGGIMTIKIRISVELQPCKSVFWPRLKDHVISQVFFNCPWKFLATDRHVDLFFIPPLPEGGGGYTVLPLSFRPSKIFFVAFFSVTVDGRNLIFGHKRHIGIPYCG